MIMKKTILITILALLGITQAMAQEYEYVPFVREGVKWVYYINYPEWSNPNPNFNVGLNYRTLEIKGDVVINGKTYKAMHKYSGDAIDPHNDTIPIYLREEDNVVYGIIPDGKMYYDCPIKISWLIDEYNGEEFVLYDFNDQESFWDGILNIDFDDCYEFISTQFITLGSHRAKQYVNKYNGTDFYFIEGIGIDTFTNGFMLYPFMGQLLSGPMFHLSHVIENDEIVYKSVNYLEPEPDDYEYVPFVREGVKWVYYYTNYDDTYPASPYLPIGTIYLNLEFKGDTIINGKTYKAMHKYYGKAINVNSDTIPIYMRENDKVVYAIVPNGTFYKDCPIGNNAWTEEEYEPCYSGQEFILYDFNNPVTYWDDLVNQHNWYQYTDTIVVGQHLAKRVVGNMPVIFHQIEGVGIDGYSSYILSFFMPMLVGIGGPFFHLSHVIEDGKIIYKGMRFNPALFENPGDVNGDGEVNIADANSVIDIVILGGNAGHTRAPAADANHDGEVNIGDINYIINFILNGE